MTKIRAEKVKRVENYIPELKAEYCEEGDLLVVGWGGTYGSLHSAVQKLHVQGVKIGHVHFNYINPLPKNTEEVFSKFKKVVVCELNKGQLSQVLKARFTKQEFLQYNKVLGLPFSVSDLVEKFKNLLKEE
jgi:2-oxoglutarate ferredoxin oxidoreductase subunit alpha